MSPFILVENFKANAGYGVIVSNAFGPPGVLSARANLALLPDFDGYDLPVLREGGCPPNALESTRNLES